jgi:N utilization substance protein B
MEGDTYAEGNIDLFDAILLNAVNQQAKIDQMTDRALVAKWPIDRIDPTVRAIFRAAGAEFVIGDTPPKVAITEYVDVSKAFFPEGNESRFVNAVLDHMAREAHPDKFA